MKRLYITNASDAGNLSVHLTFSDNTSQIVDIGAFIRQYPHPQYNKYLDEEISIKLSKKYNITYVPKKSK